MLLGWPGDQENMNTVNMGSDRGCWQDCKVHSSSEAGVCLVSAMSRGPVVGLCVHMHMCVFVLKPVLTYLLLNFGFSLYVRSFNIA